MATYTQQSKLSSNNNFESTTFFFVNQTDLTFVKNEIAIMENSGITITNIALAHKGSQNNHDVIVTCAGKILQS
jgi:hypothetical protein